MPLSPDNSTVPGYEDYPAFTFPSSVTYNSWVYLTCAQLHALRAIPEFQGQKTYFHLNHPIKWIRITGVVVSVDHYDRFGLAELDDSSGRTVELKYDLPEVKHKELDLGDGKDTAVIPTGNSEAMAKSEVQKSEPLEKSRPEDQIDHTLLEVGNVVCVKGTIRTYRHARQVDVIKLALVPSTTHELAQMRALLSFQSTHLRKPWVLTAEEVATLKVAGSVAEKKRIAREVECRKLGLSEEQWREKRRGEKEEKRRKERERRREERERREEEQERRREERRREERRREREAERVRREERERERRRREAAGKFDALGI